MPIDCEGGRIRFIRLEIATHEIGYLLTQHAKRFPNANKVEEHGAALIAEGFRPAASAAFVEMVCEWGRGHRSIGRVRGSNTDKDIAAALSDAVTLSNQDRVSDAVERIKKLRHLGQSFASKQLRFLQPNRAVILDSVIRNKLGYPETAAGYDEFLGNCYSALSSVEATLPHLRLCDIEAAIFAKLQGYKA